MLRRSGQTLETPQLASPALLEMEVPIKRTLRPLTPPKALSSIVERFVIRDRFAFTAAISCGLPVTELVKSLMCSAETQPPLMELALTIALPRLDRSPPSVISILIAFTLP